MIQLSRSLRRLAVLLAGSLVAPGPARGDDAVVVDLPAGLAVETLQQLGLEAHLNILFHDSEIEEIKTPPVNGSFKPLEALRKLLSGTGLTYEAMPGGSLFVHPSAQSGRNIDKSASGTASQRVPGSVNPISTVVVISHVGLDGSIHVGGIQSIDLSRADILDSNRSIAQLLQTVPQNFGGGPNENTVRGGGAETNSGSGSGVNLRGLSDGATVVLINGRRLAPSGTAADFTDIANIPLSAIERIEIIPEGATARFGADAVGGTVNFVLRQDPGLETAAEVGGFAKGARYLERFNQSVGVQWEDSSLFADFDYDERDALNADRRRLATSNLTPFGGQNFDTPYGNPGTLQAYSPTGDVFWAIPHGQTGTVLQPSQLLANARNLYDLDAGTALPRQQLASFVLTLRQKQDEGSSLFADALFSHRLVRSTAPGETLAVSVPSSNPHYVNPVGGTEPVTVLYGFGRDLGLVTTGTTVDSGLMTVGIDFGSSPFDSLEFYESYAYERQHRIQNNLVNPGALNPALADPNPSTSLNVFGDGSYTNPATLAAIRSNASLGLLSRLGTINLTSSSSLFRLPGGPAVLTVSGEYRKQFLESDARSPGSPVTKIGVARITASGYLNIAVPFVGAKNAVPGVDALTLSAALRYEHYSDVRSVLAPQYSLFYQPTRRLQLRGSWAKLFHPPELGQLSQTNYSFLYPLQAFDPKTRSDYYETTLILVGSNPALTPEEAHTWTAGLDFLPVDDSALTVGMTYFQTLFTGRISAPPTYPANALLDPHLSWLLLPTNATTQGYYCAHSQFIGTQSDCATASIGAIVNLRPQNLDSVETRGIDAATQYRFDWGRHEWGLRLDATYLLRYSEQQTPSTLVQSLRNTDHHPLDLRCRTAFSWRYGALRANVIMNFQSGYTDVDSTPRRTVSPWVTADAALGYELRLSKVSSTAIIGLSLSAQNVTNSLPPFVNNQYGVGYDQENASLNGRLVSFGVRYRW